MKRREWLVMSVVLIVVAFILMASIPIRTRLLIYSPRTAGASLLMDIESGSPIVVEFLHSALKSQVQEIYSVDNQQRLILVEAVYQSLGFGMPSDTPAQFSEEGSRYHWRGINRIIGVLDMRIGKIARQTLSVNGQTVNLLDHYPEGTLVRIKAVSRSLALELTERKNEHKSR